MPVTYEPPLRSGSASPGDFLAVEWVRSGPAYARAPRSSRWHMVRSATKRLDEDYRTGDVMIRTSWSMWCGQSMFERTDGRWAGPVLLVDEPPPQEPTCGTCYGRALGADQERPQWRFDPTRLIPPKVCPGTRREWVTLNPGSHNHGTCQACGVPVRLRAGGSPYNPHWGAESHPPGPGLIPGCPFHAWRQLTTALARDDTPVVICRCQTIYREGTRSEDRDH